VKVSPFEVLILQFYNQFETFQLFLGILILHTVVALYMLYLQLYLAIFYLSFCPLGDDLIKISP